MVKKILLSVFVTLLAAVGIFTFRRTAAQEESETFICSAGIEAGLTEGPNAPLDLSGEFVLEVNAEDLTFEGVLTLKDGTEIKATGQGVGRGIDLVFETPDGKLLFAHGSQQYSLAQCEGFAGGPLVGPDFGDHGDWTVYPPYIRTLPVTNP